LNCLLDIWLPRYKDPLSFGCVHWTGRHSLPYFGYAVGRGVTNRPRNKRRTDGYDSDTSDASGDYEIVDPAQDIENMEEDPYAGEDSPMISTESKGDSDSS
jgi:hypothetical protein